MQFILITSKLTYIYIIINIKVNYKKIILNPIPDPIIVKFIFRFTEEVWVQYTGPRSTDGSRKGRCSCIKTSPNSTAFPPVAATRE
jgi:hypothetical protein